MNAISSAQDTARNIAILQRLAELGMQLAEQAAAEALRAPYAAEAGKHGRHDPTLLFIRLSAMVQGCITDRIRLAESERKAGNSFNEICQAFGISYETSNLPMQ